MSKKIYIGSTEIAGSDGKSAYQSWLDQGNVGTEAQFVASLKGADGKDGKDGAQGNTGSSVDYPYELVNNVTTNDATKGLSAAQGVVLDEKISQLGLETIDLNEFVPVMCLPAASNKWVSLNTNYPFMGIFIPCNGNEKFLLESLDSDISYCCLTTPAYVNGTNVDYATGFSGNGKTVPIGGGIITVPSDAKYIWIRMSKDGGTTYVGPTRVAIVQDAETIANNVADKVEEATDIELNGAVTNVARGRYLAGSGAIGKDESWGFTTDYIPVQAGDMIYWSPGVVKSTAYLTFYDSSKAFLTNFTANATSRTQKAPTNTAYIRASFALSAINDHPVVVNSKIAWSPIETAQGAISFKKLYLPVEKSEGGCYLRASDGAVITMAALVDGHVNTYRVSPGLKYYVSGRVFSSSIGSCALGAFYQEDGTFISSFIAATSTGVAYTDYEVTAPESAAYMKVEANIDPITAPSEIKVWTTVNVSELASAIGDVDNLHSYGSRDVTPSLVNGAAINYTTLSQAVNNSYKYAALPVKAGEKYTVFGSWISATLPAVILCNNARTQKTTLLDATSAQFVCGDITIPDGYEMMYVNARTADGGYINIIKHQTFTPLAEKEEFSTIKEGDLIFARGGKIDAVVGSATFGEVILATFNGWAVSGYVDLQGAKFIRYRAALRNASGNYYGVTGAVFYDKNLQPLTEGVRLIEQGTSLNAYTTAVVPSNARYMRVSTGYSVSPNPDYTRYTLYFINSDDVINDDGLGLTQYAYNGPKYTFEEHSVAFKRLMTMSGLNPIPQGGDCFGKYLFQFVSGNTVMRVYDLEAKAIVDTVDIAEGQRGFVTNCHSNTVTFSRNYYADGDEFPIIYVSTGYSNGGYTGALGYRIQRTDNDFTLTLVQTLKFPPTSDGSIWTEFVVAGDSCYVCYTSIYRAYRFQMPLLSDGEEVIFNLSDALEVIQFTEVPASFNGSRYQDRIYHDGRIFAISGVPGDGEKSCLQVLNLATQERESVIDFTEMGLTDESESIFIYNEHLYVSFASSIVQLFFK